MGPRFRCLRVVVADAELAGRAAAEAHAAGASGLEERSDRELLIYAPEPAMGRVARALAALAAAAPGRVALGAHAAVPDTPWEEHWKRGLGVIHVSPRLAVRPPFVADEGARALVVEPGQAFGTGGHASTRLALRVLDALADSVLPGARVLDVGTGSGVLALAALRLGAFWAVAFDLDPLAAPAARRNADANDLGRDLALFTGPIGALTSSFDVVLANLLRTELEPLLEPLASRLAAGGYAILSGLLGVDREPLEAQLTRVGLAITSELRESDADGTCWLGLAAVRLGPEQPGGPGA